MKIMQLDVLTYVGPQISLSDVTELKRRGVKKIIVVRPEGETDDQPTISDITYAANAAGIVVHQIPVVPGHITDEAVKEFGTFVAQTTDPIFAYCRSGIRATSLWALTQSKNGHSTDNILRTAHSVGYDLSPMTSRLDAQAAIIV
jgi:sulfide:quinone oxidoreductase